MVSPIRPLVTVAFAGLLASRAAADPSVADVTELSLAELLDTRVDVASKKPQAARATAGIVTVITREEIEQSGARDLVDLLAMVPGFAPAVDVEGVIDFGIRGQWAHEGKLLLLIDGQPMNELLYSTLPLADHYPLAAIERIEVIRGPGSAVHGGFAELAVIDIITRGASLEGVVVGGTYGQAGTAVGRANLDLGFGTKRTGIAGLAVAGHLSIGHAGTTGHYRDFAGDGFAMEGNAARNPMFGKLAVTYKQLRVDAIADNYSLLTRDGVGPAMPAPLRQGFRAFHVDARYAIRLRKRLTLTPHLGWIRQSPWRVADPASDLFYRKTVTRYTAGAALSYEPTKRLDFLAGVETYLDRARLDEPTLTGLQTAFDGHRTVAYDTIATYAQVIANHKLANLTLGARYEHHSAVGGSLVPRAALTKVHGKLHGKLLASQAFRAPGIENISLGGEDLVPEKTTVFEAELGYQLTAHMAVVVNAFDITIKQPIIYGYDQASMAERYQNGDRTGTRGVEVGYRVQHPRGSLNLSYSFYSARGKNAVDAYRVPDREDVLLAFPAHKVAAAGHLKLHRGLSFDPSAVVYGARYGYLEGDADGAPMIGRHAPTAIVNTYATYRDLFARGLHVSAGISDVANQRLHYLQPYDGGHAPLPAAGREVVVRASYERRL